MDTLPAIEPAFESPGLDEEARVIETRFGDGYSQTAADGINNIGGSLPLEWRNITTAQADTLIAFFRAKAGYLPFRYKIPTESAAWVWKCKRWHRDHDRAGLTNVYATLERAFDFE